MVEDGPDISPVPVEIVLPGRCGAPTQLEHALGRAWSQLTEDQLHPRGDEGAVDQRSLDQVRVPGAEGIGRVLQGPRAFGHQSIDRQ